MSKLTRQVGLFGAVLLGLGSMLGTGVYASLGMAIPRAAQAWEFALFLATITAMCNGLSSARLAARYPVSGGTYTYGYELLHWRAGFAAGWLFLIAKSASAAAAVLACAALLPLESRPVVVAVALGILLALTLAANGGLKRGNRLNLVLVGLSVLGLLAFVIWGNDNPVEIPARDPDEPFVPGEVFAAAALLFVAFTGYGRVATMGEEIKDPAQSIPRAVIVTVLATAVVYSMVGGAAAGRFLQVSEATEGDPAALTLQSIAAAGGAPSWVSTTLAVGAIAALLGVTFNLILGLSRVALAMARRRDLPEKLSEIREKGSVPAKATWFVFFLIAGFSLVGLKFAWEISAGAVLVYYGIANICAWKLPDAPKFTKPVALLGMASCFHLAVHVSMKALGIVLVLVVIGSFVRGMVKPDDSEDLPEAGTPKL